MKKFFIFFSVTAILFIIFFSCQQTGGSSGGGGGGDDDSLPKWASQFKTIASDAADEDRFGYSVSISGDYAIIGAYSEDGVGGTNKGAAYIFHRTGANTWDTGFKITASDAADDDQFGNSVSISGDYAIIGAPYEDGGGTDRGAAYIFHRTGDNIWEETGKLKASDAQDEDQYGCSVSISGDYAIIGALWKDGAGSNRGAAYIYQLSMGTEAKIIPLDTSDGDRFGCSVSISGDYVIVGAVGGGGGMIQGAAYIFLRTGLNTWDAGFKITASDAADGDLFGSSVSISGNYVIVGANGAGSSKGAAYIFHRTGENIWDVGTKLVAFDMADDDHYSYSVSISGDYVIIGAPNEDGSVPGSVTNRGAVYIYHRTGTNTWGTGIKILASDAGEDDSFGYSVSIFGDYAIIGSCGEDSGGINSGAAYILK